MKQQQYEALLMMMIKSYAQHGYVDPNLLTKARILLNGGNASASVAREMSNFEPRDPENMDPYGAQNHKLKGN